MQFSRSAELMRKCFEKYLKTACLLSADKDRVLNIFELNNSQFEPMKDINLIQQALQVKKFFVLTVYIIYSMCVQNSESKVGFSTRKTIRDRSYH